MTKFVALRPKLYAYKTFSRGGDKKCKGVKKFVVKKRHWTLVTTNTACLKSIMAWVPSLICKNQYFCHCEIIMSCMAVKFCTSKVFRP